MAAQVKTGRGGARVGAGRKKRDDSWHVTLTLPKDTEATLSQMAARLGTTRPALMRRIIMAQVAMESETALEKPVASAHKVERMSKLHQLKAHLQEYHEERGVASSVLHGWEAESAFVVEFSPWHESHEDLRYMQGKEGLFVPHFFAWLAAKGYALQYDYTEEGIEKMLRRLGYVVRYDRPQGVRVKILVHLLDTGA